MVQTWLRRWLTITRSEGYPVAVPTRVVVLGVTVIAVMVLIMVNLPPDPLAE
jgi:hypothetical protein